MKILIKRSISPEQIADLFRKSEVFYSYEDTSLATEAILCGCPVVFIKNEFFKQGALASFELGLEGCVYSVKPEELQWAKDTVEIAQQKFAKATNNYWMQLESFIETTQGKSLGVARSKQMKIANKRKPIGRIIKSKIKSFIG
jgi:hypothetical protein